MFLKLTRLLKFFSLKMPYWNKTTQVKPFYFSIPLSIAGKSFGLCTLQGLKKCPNGDLAALQGNYSRCAQSITLNNIGK